ncbi:MAG: hypothetical protein K0S11_621 [Gammaproteobacteria bacterium]|nr:hypothetical protein [Gammaproteobacteria bacterium]
MPMTLTYPGVYVEEVPSGVRTMTGVATSVTAFVGRCLKGPLDQAITINSWADFERKFGGLWSDSALTYAVRDFYANGGSQAIIIRVFKDKEQKEIDLPAVNGVLYFKGVNPGSWVNNLKLVLDTTVVVGLANRYDRDKKLGFDDSDFFNCKIIDKATNSVLEEYRGVTLKEGERRLDSVLKNESQLLTVSGSFNLANGTKPNGFRLKCDKKGLNLQINKGVMAPIAVTINYATAGELADSFDLKLVSADGAEESYTGLTVTDGENRIDLRLNGKSQIVTVLTDSSDVLKDETAKRKRPEPGSVMVPFAPQIVKGNDGDSLDDKVILGKASDKTGLYALDQTNIFNLLCIPPYKAVDGADRDNSIDDVVITNAAQYCLRRRAFLLLDPPASWKSKDKAKSGIDSLAAAVGDAGKNAAVFYPRIMQPDPLQNNQLVEFSPCGAIAGSVARIDAQRGIWKAPAGLEANLNGVTQLSNTLTDQENGELHPLGINCLRFMPGVGSVVWGARTVQGNDMLGSEWKYIPIRRMALYIEESVYRGLLWVVHEPNDESLWRQISLNLDSFMNGLFRQGAFQGRTKNEAYFIKCDKETTTADDVARGIVNIKLGFAPLKPAEFVVVKLQQIAGQTQV